MWGGAIRLLHFSRDVCAHSLLRCALRWRPESSGQLQQRPQIAVDTTTTHPRVGSTSSAYPALARGTGRTKRVGGGLQPANVARGALLACEFQTNPTSAFACGAAIGPVCPSIARAHLVLHHLVDFTPPTDGDEHREAGNCAWPIGKRVAKVEGALSATTTEGARDTTISPPIDTLHHTACEIGMPAANVSVLNAFHLSSHNLPIRARARTTVEKRLPTASHRPTTLSRFDLAITLYDSRS